MKTAYTHVFAPGVLALALMLALSACSYNRPRDKQAGPLWKVEPVMRAGNSPGASPRYGEVFYRLGRSQALQGRMSQAEVYYRKAIAADPEHADAHNALGVLLGQTGRLTEALAVLDRAVQLDPTDAGMRNNLGYAHYLAGQRGAASAQFREALRIEPGNARAVSNLRLASAGDAPPLAPANPVADLRSAPSLVLTEVSPQRIELAFSAAPAQGPSAGETGEMPPLRLAERTGVIKVAGDVQGEALPQPASGAAGPAYRLEISNGMGLRGAARRLNAMLMREGAPAARLNDQRPFRQLRTRVMYAEGYRNEAERLARRVGGEIVSASGLQGARAVHLRIVLGKDVRALIAALPDAGNLPLQAGWAPPQASAAVSASRPVPGA